MLSQELKMSQKHIPHKTLRQQIPGERKLGRPNTTWQRTVETVPKEMGVTWTKLRMWERKKGIDGSGH